MKIEHKTFNGFTKSLDEDQGMVEAIVAVTGNLDMGNDIIMGGAFAKTIQENIKRIRVLDNHRTDSVEAVIGMVVEGREIPRTELPKAILEDYPEATGGLYTKTQYLMDTPEGRGAFSRIKSGAVSEYSIGYDAREKDYEDVEWRGQKVRARILKQIRLWEYSPVIWGMNEGTSTVSAKKETPNEIKPWKVFKEGEKWCVYKVGEDGKPVGRRLGTHDTEAEAEAQVRALYANEEDGKKPKTVLGNVTSGMLHKVLTTVCDDWYALGVLTDDDKEIFTKAITAAVNALIDGIPSDLFEREVQFAPTIIAMGVPTVETQKTDAPNEKAASDEVQEVGSDQSETTEATTPAEEPDALLAKIKLMEAKINLELSAIESQI